MFLTSLILLSLEALAAARLSSQASATVVMAVSDALRSTEEPLEPADDGINVLVLSSITGTVCDEEERVFSIGLLNYIFCRYTDVLQDILGLLSWPLVKSLFCL